MFLLLNTLNTTPEMLLFCAEDSRTLQTPAVRTQYYLATGVVGEGRWRLRQVVNHVTKFVGLVKWYKVR